MTVIPVENRANLSAEQFASLAATLAGHRTIKRALDWSLSLDPPVAPADVIALDELSHDVLVGLTDPAGCWLAYDCT